MDFTLLLLRAVHIVGGIFWVGAGMMMSFFIVPALNGAGPAAGAVVAGLQRRRLMSILPMVALATMLSGATLIWRMSGGDIGAYARSRAGSTFTMGAGFAILGFLVGMIVARPSAMQAGGLLRQLASATEQSERTTLEAQLVKVQARAARSSIVSTLLLVVAALAMAVARYR